MCLTRYIMIGYCFVILFLQDQFRVFPQLTKLSFNNFKFPDRGAKYVTEKIFNDKLRIPTEKASTVSNTTDFYTSTLDIKQLGGLSNMSQTTKVVLGENDYCKWITLQAPEDYFMKLSKSKNYGCCRLILRFQKDYSWQNITAGEPNITVTEIVSLGNTPHLAFTRILETQDKVRSIKVHAYVLSVQINTTSNRSDSTEPQRTSPIRLTHLHVLELNSNDSCERLTQFWYQNFKITNLLNVSFACRFATPGVLKNIQSILENNHFSLQKVTFEMTDWNKPLFSHYIFPFREMRELHIVTKGERNKTVNIFGSSISKILPNLSTLNITGGFIQLGDIIKFRSLQTLSVGILTHQRSFNASSIIKSFPNLKTMLLHIEFLNTSDCNMKADNLNNHLSSSEVSSNCKIM